MWTNSDRIEVGKVLVGAIFSVVAGAWTYSVYTAEARKEELASLAAISKALGGVNTTCKSDWVNLSQFADIVPPVTRDDEGDLVIENGNRKAVCYQFFEDLSRQAETGKLTIDKPYFTSNETWTSHWKNMINAIRGASSGTYQFSDIDSPWRAILNLKGLSTTE